LSKSKEKIKLNIRKHSSETSHQLKPILETKLSKSKQVIMKNLLKHRTKGKTTLLESSPIQDQPSSSKHIESTVPNWYWIMVALTLGSAIAVLAVGDVGPQAYIRYIAASVFVLFLPGYAFLTALSPLKAPNSEESNQMDTITRFALSMVLSIAMVSVLGLILDFSPLGVNLNSLVLSLSLFTLLFSTIGLVRERQNT
jgi:hypothetical protein